MKYDSVDAVGCSIRKKSLIAKRGWGIRMERGKSIGTARGKCTNNFAYPTIIQSSNVMKDFK